MEGVGEPDLLVRGAGSPHTYSMRPSEAAMLEGADVVFWVGPELEMFLSGALDTLAAGATVVELRNADGLVQLEYREGGPFEAHTHDHDDHGHDHDEGHGHDDHGHDHDDHGHDHDEGHGHDDHGHDHDDHGHDHDEGHGHDDHGHDHDDHGHDHDESHGHDDHGHDHDDHGHDHDEGHGHDDHGHDHDDHGHDHDESHGHDDHGHGHHHGAYDMHFWLDPENAKAFVDEIESTLVATDPDNADTYAQNADALRERLDELLAETSEAVADIADRGFIVFHDAYQYYENRFGVTATGSITVSPEVMPGAARIDEIRTRVRDLDVACVFAEPQFEPRLVQVVTEGTEARAGVLDPLGADLEDGPELYFDLIRNLTTSLTECLQGEG
ncbi:MAG: zinc ABC transporter substrate-binding protein [Rhizobiaceae bacterium]